MGPLLLTEKQVCDALAVSRPTVRRLMSLRALVPVRIGRSIRFSADDINRYVQTLRAEANDDNAESIG